MVDARPRAAPGMRRAFDLMTPVCWLARVAEDSIRAEAARYPKEETGGLLLGYFSLDGSVVVAEATGPGPLARRTANSFHPDVAWQRHELAHRYATSGRINTYLGDWHSHPGGAVNLSRTDRQTLRRIARTSTARAPDALMAVVAPDADGCIAMWQHRSRPRHPRRLDWSQLR